jgi:16S rRNA (cytidine1402-2'-O)-methyltransferase
MLYLVSTPIGNLGDITYRAVQVLQECAYVLCEDTRHSLALLERYEIRRPLKSYHKFNEKTREEEVVRSLREGLSLALISDAGTPSVSDPGQRLVERCRRENLPVTALPGPCAAITALTLTGFDTAPFQFAGFLPKKQGALEECLRRLLLFSGTSIAYESPHRLADTLDALCQLEREREIAVARELTKIHEEVRRGAAQELAAHYRQHPPKGEVVLLIAPSAHSKTPSCSPEEYVRLLQEEGLRPIEAIKAAASLYGVPKRTLYAAVHIHK